MGEHKGAISKKKINYILFNDKARNSVFKCPSGFSFVFLIGRNILHH